MNFKSLELFAGAGGLALGLELAGFKHVGLVECDKSAVETLRVNLTAPQMKQTERCHPLEVRPFSVRENARIQSFPDEWIFCGSVANKYKQIGNAVPVNLAKAIDEMIVRCLVLR